VFLFCFRRGFCSRIFFIVTFFPDFEINFICRRGALNLVEDGAFRRLQLASQNVWSCERNEQQLESQQSGKSCAIFVQGPLQIAKQLKCYPIKGFLLAHCVVSV
jgi:hypothetical protein